MEASSGIPSGSERPAGGNTAQARWKRAIGGVREEVRKEKKQDPKWENMTTSQKWGRLTTTMTKRMKTGVADFFGIAEDSDDGKMKKKWEDRSKYLMATSRLFGKTVLPSTDQSGGEAYRSEGQGLLRDEVDSPSFKSRRMQRDEPDAHMARPTVWGLTVGGVKHIMTGKSAVAVAPCRRSFTPFCVKNARGPRPILEDDFFEYPTPSIKPAFKMAASEETGYDVPDFGVGAAFKRLGEKTTMLLSNNLVIRKRDNDELDKAYALDDTDGGFLSGLKRMSSEMCVGVYDNMNRRPIGIGFVGKCLDMDYKYQDDPKTRKQLEDLAANQHRPFFTYWVTFVQIVIYIFAVAVYGIAPIGISETRIEAEVLKQSLSIERVHYTEPDNLWIGPRQADLIHLGARYSPCMRRDSNVEYAIAEDRLKESQTACCVRNDGSGCVQSQESLCSRTLSTWLKWGVRNSTGPGGRTSGSVCGQDPRYCKNPFSLPPFEWPDDISKWPICKESLQKSQGDEDKHMKCDIFGRPCCVGIQGQCIITTREFCDFRRGYFHEEATLCSQISCMSEICGMIPFYNPEKPNQFYRLWTSLFLHAGLFQLLISMVFQWFIMRDLEKLGGWLRIGIIYITSGIAGSLGSAIFIPYHVEAGPSGSQFGILACVFVQVIQNWSVFESPCWSLGKLTLILVSLFIIGLLPMVDNWAHLFGFLFGFLLAFALLPYVTFSVMDGRRKLIGIVVCLVATVGMFLILVLLFYVIPIYKCPNCEYFNCIPFTPSFCKSMEVKITRNDEF